MWHKIFEFNKSSVLSFRILHQGYILISPVDGRVSVSDDTFVPRAYSDSENVYVLNDEPKSISHLVILQNYQRRHK